MISRVNANVWHTIQFSPSQPKHIYTSDGLKIYHLTQFSAAHFFLLSPRITPANKIDDLTASLDSMI